MALDRVVSEVSRWEALGGVLWLGDKSPNGKGRNVQDVKIEGITDPEAAIRMAGVKPFRVTKGVPRNPEHLKGLVAYRLQKHTAPLESFAETQEAPQYPSAHRNGFDGLKSVVGQGGSGTTTNVVNGPPKASKRLPNDRT